jgi:hypothetical protein
MLPDFLIENFEIVSASILKKTCTEEKSKASKSLML